MYALEFRAASRNHIWIQYSRSVICFSYVSVIVLAIRSFGVSRLRAQDVGVLRRRLCCSFSLCIFNFIRGCRIIHVFRRVRSFRRNGLLSRTGIRERRRMVSCLIQSIILFLLIVGIAFALKAKSINILCCGTTGTITVITINGVPDDLIPIIIVDPLIPNKVGTFIDRRYIVGHTNAVQIADKIAKEFFIDVRTVVRWRIRINVRFQLQRISSLPVLAISHFIELQTHILRIRNYIIQLDPGVIQCKCNIVFEIVVLRGIVIVCNRCAVPQHSHVHVLEFD